MAGKQVIFHSIGEAFGNLSIIELIGGSSKVKCKCGKEKIISNFHLRDGRATHCGDYICSPKFINPIGNVIGNIEIINLEMTDNRLFCICKCMCGSTFKEKHSVIVSGNKQSCGCKGYGLTSDQKLMAQTVIRSYKRGAKRRNLIWNIKDEDVEKLIIQNCHYCGSQPNSIFLRKRRTEKIPVYYNGIDRKNNNIGYEASNCITCCKFCNFAKNTKSYDEFFDWINKLVSFRNSIQ